MHRPLTVFSLGMVARFVFTTIVVLPPQTMLATNNSNNTDLEQVTITVMAQEVQPITPFRGIDRG